MIRLDDCSERNATSQEGTWPGDNFVTVSDSDGVFLDRLQPRQAGVTHMHCALTKQLPAALIAIVQQRVWLRKP